MEKEMRMVEKKLGGGLFEELLEDIFTRVPLKPLTRMKCVSKDWCRLISPVTKSRSRLSPFGLIMFEQIEVEDEHMVLPYRTLIKQFDVTVQEGEFRYLENNALSSTIDGDLSPLCFSNGLLLCAEMWLMTKNPILYDMSLKQLISLPPVHEFCHSNAIGIGLAALDSGCLPNRHFELVCFYFTGYLDYFDCVLFSSETGEWKRNRARVSNYSNINDDDMYFNCAYYTTFFEYECLFHEGLMYWAISGHFFVYHLHEGSFEIHNLPKEQYMDECLWVSEGCLHYSCIDKKGFSVWTRIKGIEIDSDDEYYQDELNRLIAINFDHNTGWWMLKHEVSFKTLKAQHPEFFSEESDGLICFHNKPCAFDVDFEILYFRLSDSLVVSYSFETGCLRKVKELSH